MTDERGGKDELSSTLAALRSEAGVSTRQAGVLAGFSQSKVNRLERGINVPTEEDVSALLDAYRAPTPVKRRLLSLARDIRAEHRPVVMARSGGRPGLFQARLGRIEAASARVRAFAPTAVPGMLQVPGYVRAVNAERGLPQERVEEFVTKRLRRQEHLLTPSAPHFTIITTEGALGWRLGARDMMAEQATHIAEMAMAEHVRVGIIPWGTRGPRLVLHAWDIYDDRAVSYGSAEATAILTEPRDVARYIELHEMVERMAVFGSEAHDVLMQIAEDYRDT